MGMTSKKSLLDFGSIVDNDFAILKKRSLSSLFILDTIEDVFFIVSIGLIFPVTNN